MMIIEINQDDLSKEIYKMLVWLRENPGVTLADIGIKTKKISTPHGEIEVINYHLLV